MSAVILTPPLSTGILAVKRRGWRAEMAPLAVALLAGEIEDAAHAAGVYRQAGFHIDGSGDFAAALGHF
ncbi:MAG: hypothetical protein M5U34_15825 [Chloroflexi bacterium]|nr:hypothetical protein [Chloroflexota bacterium]